MGVNPATFSSGGQISQHYIPGAYSRNNFIANEGGGVSSGNIVILGDSELGEPNKLLVFDSANDARAALSAGDGLEGVIQAFAPGNDLVPQQVGFMRVNPGTQSERTLQKTSSDRYKVKSFSYGVPMNQVRLKFSAGTIVGSHKIETEYKGNALESDNIERKSLSIQYTGTGSAAVVNIDATTLTTTVTGGPGGEDLSIVLADYPTISELVELINNNAVYDAVVLTDQPTQKSTEIDFVTTGDIFTTPLTLKSDYQAVFEALGANGLLSDISKLGTTRNVPDYDADFVYLSGGTSGAYTTTEFTTSLEVLEEEDVQLMATTTTEESVHILIKNHCVVMNSVDGRRERQFYVGGALGEDVASVKARALTLNSSFGSLCSPGYYQFNDDGVETLYSPAFLACKQVGMVSALALNNPTTSKTMNVLRWEKDYKRSEKNDLIKGGVLICGKDTDGLFITIRSLTTYQGSLLQKNEASIMRETLYQAADLRRRMSALIGSPNTGNDQLATVDAIFERAIQDWKGLGIIVANNGQLYSGYTRRIVGDQLVIEYNTWNTAPTNFVFITHNISLLVQ
jgi:hypothetical protein